MITKENAHLYLPLVQALKDGKTLQVTNLHEWVDVELTFFRLPPEQYRIKPEPLEINIWVDDANNTPLLRGHEICTSVLSVGEKSDGKTVRLFREVI